MRFVSTLAALFCLLLNTQDADAKIWRVNNNNGVQADFTTLDAAHAGASSGDTLHLEGSPNTYGGTTLTKKLFIVGPGYYLDQHPQTQAFAQSAKVDRIDINVGAEGSVLMGLDFRGSTIYVYCSDIIFRRNRFFSTSGTNEDHAGGLISINYHSNNGNIAVNNIVISQNFGVKVDVNRASTGILITNNFMDMGSAYGEQTAGAILTLHSSAIALVQNNIFRRGKVTANNSNFTNNIMVNGFFEGTGNLVSNNLASGTQFGSANGNLQNVDMSTVFIGSGTGVSIDGQWKLKVGSPAIGAGYGSTSAKPVDAGIFSGNTPYVLAGQPSMPAIYFFENQPVGSNTDPIDVNIKVKSAGN